MKKTSLTDYCASQLDAFMLSDYNRGRLLQGQMDSIFNALNVNDQNQANHIFKGLIANEAIWDADPDDQFAAILKGDINDNKLLSLSRELSQQYEQTQTQAAEQRARAAEQRQQDAAAYKQSVIKAISDIAKETMPNTKINPEKLYNFLLAEAKDQRKDLKLDTSTENFIKMVTQRFDPNKGTDEVLNRVKSTKVNPLELAQVFVGQNINSMNDAAKIVKAANTVQRQFAEVGCEMGFDTAVKYSQTADAQGKASIMVSAFQAKHRKEVDGFTVEGQAKHDDIRAKIVPYATEHIDSKHVLKDVQRLVNTEYAPPAGRAMMRGSQPNQQATTRESAPQQTEDTQMTMGKK